MFTDKIELRDFDKMDPDLAALAKKSVRTRIVPSSRGRTRDHA